MSGDGKELWERWYHSVPATEHARRLETIGYRLLALIALTTDKEIIDAEVVEAVTKILDYELKIRTATDPIDADNMIAKLEERIRRQLAVRGRMDARSLRQVTHADRTGLWAFQMALQNLSNVGDISCYEGLYQLNEAA